MLQIIMDNKILSLKKYHNCIKNMIKLTNNLDIFCDIYIVLTISTIPLDNSQVQICEYVILASLKIS